MENLPHAIGGLAVIAIYFGGIMLIGMACKSFLRGRDDRADEPDHHSENARLRDRIADLEEQVLIALGERRR